MNAKKLVKATNIVGMVAVVLLVYWVFVLILSNVFGLKVFREYITEIFLMSILALSAAWNAFKFREVGFKRMIYVYTPCLLQIAFASDVFSFVFYIDSVLKLWFSLTVNKLSVGINFAAILFIVLAGRNCRHLKMVSQNTDKNVEPLEQGQETQS